ncbi:hypothetical protein GCM10009846_25610 [Agrococcus versicolor]|uniref:Uncharacterized protein n=1 Tax=Agrococcus versicolor TaxID=501482 RepID=A0ABP5MLL3_9MICO
MSRRTLLGANVTAFALLLAVVSPTPAFASAPPDETEELATISEMVNPDAAEVVAFAGDGEAVATDPGPGGPVAVESSGDTTIAFSLDGAAQPYLDVSVDQSGTAEPVTVSDDGLAVAATTSEAAPHVVVSTTEQGTSIQAVLDSPAAGDEVRFDFGDAQVRLLDDGGAEVFETDAQAPGIELVLATIETPWAFDANGAAVETSFAVDGSTLVQQVAVGAETAYPVVADPYQYNGLRYPQIRWSWPETRALNANKGNYAVAIATCAGIAAASWAAAVFTGAVCAAQFVRWANAIGNAYAAGKCFAVSFNFPGPNPSSYACRK